MAYEVTRDMPTAAGQIETPLETMTSPMIDGKKLVFVPILRAGNGILDGMLNVVPGARVGHIGLYRDPATLQAVEYYFKMPSDMARARRHRARPDAGHRQFGRGRAGPAQGAETPRSIKFVCLLAAPKASPRCTSPPRRADLHRRHRPRAQRPRLHPAGPGRCGRPHLRHQTG
jgi:uracil phosphoribosyltransferase